MTPLAAWLAAMPESDEKKKKKMFCHLAVHTRLKQQLCIYPVIFMRFQAAISTLHLAYFAQYQPPLYAQTWLSSRIGVPN